MAGIVCSCGRIKEYLGGDCYACPVHGFEEPREVKAARKQGEKV
jgi:hypothetical protein